MIKVFVLNRDRLHSPKEMVEFLWTIPDVEPIIIDNASSYEPLLQWYDTKPCHIERMELNWGCCVLWQEENGLMQKYNLRQGGYCVSDSDLKVDHLPKDFIDVLFEGLRRYPQFDKCGLSLEIQGLPDNELTREVIEHEQQHWLHKLDERYIKASTDTTMAAHASGIQSFNCLRTDRPYTAIHRPWLFDGTNIPEDEIYYTKNCVQSHWTKRIREVFGI